MTVYLMSTTLKDGQGTVLEAYGSAIERHTELLMLCERCELLTGPAAEWGVEELVARLNAYGHAVTLAEQHLAHPGRLDVDLLVRVLCVIDEEDDANEHGELRRELRVAIKRRGL